MKVRHAMLAVTGAALLGGCAHLGYWRIYPKETFTIGGRTVTLSTYRCKVNKPDCVVDLNPSPDAKADWGPEVIVVEGNGGKRVHWRIKATEEWSFANPGIVFKTDAGKRNFTCVQTRFMVQCDNNRAPGDFEYAIRVLKEGEGHPIEKDPWFINR
jgi:hypothetical protein